MNEGAMAQQATQEGEINILLVNMENSLSELRLIRHRLTQVCERIYGPKPSPEQGNQAKLAAIKTATVAERLRDYAGITERLHNEIRETLREIENFI
jgi:hypothetical protein